MVLLHVVLAARKRLVPGFYAALHDRRARWSPPWLGGRRCGGGSPTTTRPRARSPRSAGAVGVDGFSLFLTIVICASVILAALLADGYLRREGLDGPELYVLMLLSAVGRRDHGRRPTTSS